MNWDGILSLLIACMEFLLFANLLFFSEKNKSNVLAMIIIFVLAVYQSVEYMICGLDIKSSFLAYLAFADISLLPPLNLVFVLSYLFKDDKKLYLLFLPAAFFIVYYAVVIEQFEVVRCTVLYAAYNYPLGTVFGVFYYSLIAVSFIVLAFTFFNGAAANKKKTIGLLLAGHFLIMLPVIAGFIFKYSGNDYLINIIESIMCKFAFGYAICLALFILNNKSGTDERNYS